MNKKIGIAILLAACVGLAIVLAVVKTHDNKQHNQDANKITVLSTQLDETNAYLNDLRQTNLKLNTDLAANRAADLEMQGELWLKDE